MTSNILTGHSSYFNLEVKALNQVNAAEEIATVKLIRHCKLRKINNTSSYHSCILGLACSIVWALSQLGWFCFVWWHCNVVSACTQPGYIDVCSDCLFFDRPTDWRCIRTPPFNSLSPWTGSSSTMHIHPDLYVGWLTTFSLYKATRKTTSYTEWLPSEWHALALQLILLKNKHQKSTHCFFLNHHQWPPDDHVRLPPCKRLSFPKGSSFLLV